MNIINQAKNENFNLLLTESLFLMDKTLSLAPTYNIYKVNYNVSDSEIRNLTAITDQISQISPKLKTKTL